VECIHNRETKRKGKANDAKKIGNIFREIRKIEIQNKSIPKQFWSSKYKYQNIQAKSQIWKEIRTFQSIIRLRNDGRIFKKFDFTKNAQLSVNDTIFLNDPQIICLTPWTAKQTISQTLLFYLRKQMWVRTTFGPAAMEMPAHKE
jgi:hypothetical protein